MSSKPSDDHQQGDQTEWKALDAYQGESHSEENEQQQFDELQELRRLLLAPEQARLEQITERMQQLESRQRIFQIKNKEQQVHIVSRALPQAVSMHKGHDSQLAKALSPTIEETLKISAQQNPQPLVDAIFPVMGPAIRKSVREAMRSLLDMVNQTLEHSLSIKSMKWRLEARRTGRSFSEVLLSHTLNYRVEQIFLIDRTSGLPLQHVTAENVKEQDSALVSSMLSAIHEFVRDSFQTETNDVLDTLQMGNLNVLVEDGPKALLAAVVCGVPSPSLRESLKELIERIHLQFRQELIHFNGDTTPFMASRPMLKKGLLADYIDERRKLSWIPRLVLTVLLISIGALLFFFVRERLRWRDYIDLLKTEPGIIVTESGRHRGTWSVEGLRDPLAASPSDLLAQMPLWDKPIEESWAGYHSLEPPIIARRAAQFLEAPPSVSFIAADEVLYASGSATPNWRVRARERIPLFTGLNMYHDGGLDTGERAFRKQFGSCVDSIEHKTLRFFTGMPLLIPNQDNVLTSIATEVVALSQAADSVGWSLRLRIYGHASTEGIEALNLRLSQQRAIAIRNAVSRAGFPATSIDVIGTGKPLYPSDVTTDVERERNRSVSFVLSVDEE